MMLDEFACDVAPLREAAPTMQPSTPTNEPPVLPATPGHRRDSKVDACFCALSQAHGPEIIIADIATGKAPLPVWRSAALWADAGEASPTAARPRARCSVYSRQCRSRQRRHRSLPKTLAAAASIGQGEEGVIDPQSIAPLVRGTRALMQCNDVLEARRRWHQRYWL